MATDVESYYTDHNRYPVGFGYPEGYARYRLARITTPVAYMTSIPDDPFTTKLAGLGGSPGDKPILFIYCAIIIILLIITILFLNLSYV